MPPLVIAKATIVAGQSLSSAVDISSGTAAMILIPAT
jgi:hypothetical protein